MNAEFTKIKNKVLGPEYDLSVAFLSKTQMRKAMMYKKPRRLRSKVGVPTDASGDKVSNVLAFPLSKKSGEILLCRAAAKPFTVEYLFIHGLFHLKGLQHGATMDAAEERVLKEFRICKKLSQE